MSKITHLAKIKETQEFTIKETDFFLKLLIRSQLDGVDVEVAYKVINKLSDIHKAKLEN